MILSVILYFLLSLVALISGSFIYHLFFPKEIPSCNYTKLFSYFWIGLISWPPLLLLSSTLVPLNAYTGLGLLSAVLVLGYIFPKARFGYHDVKAILKNLSGVDYVIICLLAISIGLYSGQDIFWFDTAAYHARHLHWLHDFGSTENLIAHKELFGFTPGWFALFAPFAASSLKNHILTTPGTFILFVITAQALFLLKTLCTTGPTIEARIRALYFILSSVLAVLLTIKWGVLLSPSPDVPCLFGIIVLFWFVLNDVQPSNSSKPAKISLPTLFLSAGLISIKLPCAYLFACLCLAYFFLPNGTADCSTFFLRLKHLIFIGLYTLIPVVLVSFITSGSLLFPSPFLCLGKHAMPCKAVAGNILYCISSFAQSHGKQINLLTETWWLVWPTRHWEGTVSFVFMLLSCVSFVMLFFVFYKKNVWKIALLIILGLGGSLYVMLTAPALRFGFPYFSFGVTFAAAYFMITKIKTQPLPIILPIFCCGSFLIILTGVFIWPINTLQQNYYTETNVSFYPSYDTKKIYWRMPPKPPFLQLQMQEEGRLYIQ